MASQFGTQFKTSAEILAEMKAQAKAQQQATIQSNISRASTPEEIAGTGIGNFLGTLGVNAFKKHFPSAPTTAQQNAQALGNILGQVNQVGTFQPPASVAGVGGGGIVNQAVGGAQQAQQLPQSQIFALQAQKLQSEMANASPENQQIMSQMQTNLLGQAAASRKEEDRIAGLEADKQAAVFDTKSNNVTANTLIERGHEDLADLAVAGDDRIQLTKIADARDKVIKDRADAPPAANKFLKNDDGTYSVVDNDGNVLNTVADPQAANKDKKRHNKLMSDLAQTDTVMNNTADMRVLGGLEGAAGGSYHIMKNVPDTDSFRLANKIETVKANLTFDQLAQMRAESKDGSSGLGQVAVVEIGLLGAAVANLDPGAGLEAFNEQLDDIEAHYDNYRNILLGKTPKINWEDPAYADNTRVVGDVRYFKDASGKWYEVGK